MFHDQRLNQNYDVTHAAYDAQKKSANWIFRYHVTNGCYEYLLK